MPPGKIPRPQLPPAAQPTSHCSGLASNESDATVPTTVPNHQVRCPRFPHNQAPLPDTKLGGLEPPASWVRWKSGHLPASARNHGKGAWLCGFRPRRVPREVDLLGWFRAVWTRIGRDPEGHASALRAALIRITRGVDGGRSRWADSKGGMLARTISRGVAAPDRANSTLVAWAWVPLSQTHSRR